MGEIVVSILMLTYNRETMVKKAIESIINQTFRNFEFIIVDNGSTDNSGKIADEYANKDNRIKVIHRQKGTISAGRNTALDFANGKYITFIDDDDWAEPDFIEFLVNLIEEANADVSICGATDKVFNEKIFMSAEEALIELMWRKKYNVAFPTKLFRKDIIKNLRFPEDKVFDDIALMYRLLAETNIVAYHGLAKYTFYRHNENNSIWTTNYDKLTPEILEEYLEAYDIRTKWLSKKFPNSSETFRYFEWSFMISMVDKINKFNLLQCKPILEKLCLVLNNNKDEFLSSPHILYFEKDWVNKYV